MSDDSQEIAEGLDEDVVDDVDDRGGDEFGEALPQYPPDRPVGVNTVGVTAVEEDGGESLAERVLREEPESGPADESRAPGQLADDSATTEDHEEQLVGELQPATELGPEERAIHIEPD